MLEESAQIWRYDAGRDFVFRIRRRVDNELQVQRLAMRHEQPLRYDWLHTTGMLPEALEIGGKCVTRQVAALLGGKNLKTPRPFMVNILKLSA